MTNELKGYRTELAMEIFEEIESKMMFVRDHTGDIQSIVTIKDITKLKKKYESEGAE